MLFMKGCQKKVIFIKNTGSRMFDEAYFIISRKSEDSRIEQDDMVLEANRIIDDSLDGTEPGRARDRIRKILGYLIPFSAGVVISSVAYTLYAVLL